MGCQPRWRYADGDTVCLVLALLKNFKRQGAKHVSCADQMKTDDFRKSMVICEIIDTVEGLLM